MLCQEFHSDFNIPFVIFVWKQESAASFFNSNTDHSDASDMDESNRLPDFIQCDTIRMDESPEINEPIETKTARHKVKPKKPNHRTETKGLKKDTEKGYHCLDCGRKYKQKSGYNEHRRL